MSEVIVHVLGTAQDAGLPHPNCFCENCLRAMQNPAAKRTAASLAVVLPEEKSWHLIDATPDLKEQMIHLQIKYNLKEQLMASIFLTHAHLGHYPGLLFFGKEAMNTHKMPVFVGEKMENLLKKDAPWIQLTTQENIRLKQMESQQEIKLSTQVSIIPIEVPHRNEFSETFGFWIQKQNKKILYIPDIDRWEQWDVNIYEACKEADICLLDGTFYSEQDFKEIDRDPREIPHPLITDTMERLQSLTEQTEIYFVHLNHSNPVLNPNSNARAVLEKRGFHIAEDGMEFIL